MNKKFWNKKKILITGSTGFVGKNLKNFFLDNNKKINFKLLLPSRKQLNLLYLNLVEKYFSKHKPDYVIHLAGKVGGINANRLKPAEFFYENVVMNTNVIHACHKFKVIKILSLGAGCAYSDKLKQPLKESDLWYDLPNENLIGYSIAKRLLSLQSDLYNKQYIFNSIILLPANIYGPYDNFDVKYSSVMPSLIKKVLEAKKNKNKFVEVWGDGSSTREFIYVFDLCKIIIEAMEKLHGSKTLNVGSGQNTSIKSLIKIIIKLANYTGSINWNIKMPSGQKSRLFNKKSFRQNLSFSQFTPLEDGILNTINYCKKLKK
jgi:GDP-L-fucose synthase